MDDSLLAINDITLLHETKSFLSKNFEMKELGDTSFVIGIQIQRERTRGILGLSQKAYIDKVLGRYGMKKCSPSDIPVTEKERLSLLQCPKNNYQKEQMKDIIYASTVGGLMYAQVCTHPYITYAIGKLDRYVCNLGIDHW